MTRPFRSIATALAEWPQIDGVLRELTPFAECSMCQKDVKLGRREKPEWTTVSYRREPTCIDHAFDLKELTEKARYAKAAMDTLARVAHDEREDEEEEPEDGEADESDRDESV